MDTYLSDNIVMDESGNLWLLVEDGEDVPYLNFEFDVETGNCYIDESSINWIDVDYYVRDSEGNITFVKGGSEENV